MGVDEKTNTAVEAADAGETQSKKAAKKQAKDAAKAAKVNTYGISIWEDLRSKFLFWKTKEIWLAFINHF